MTAQGRADGLGKVGSALVIGLGVSGRAAADRLLREGKKVTVNDISTAEPVCAAAAELSARGAEVALGHHDLALLAGIDLVVVSPGVPARLPLLREAQAKGVPVWSEVEMAWRLARGPVVAVTGTNGKTTTVSMIEEICRQAGREVVAAGNIGHPLVAAVDEAEAGAILVVEVSSFQLVFTHTFRPAVAVLLNVAEDHFDWHRDMEEYVAAKSRIWMNQGQGDVAVCNLDDPACVRASASAPAQVIYYSRRDDPLAAVYMSGDRMVSRLALGPLDALEAKVIMRAQELALPGAHNLENAMAAVCAAIALGLDLAAAATALSSFRGLAHRLQLVAEVGGVRFYDDSKATNPHAAMRALASFPGPLVVILGGKNKGLSFHELAAELGERGRRGEVRLAYLIGEAAEEIAGALSEAGAGVESRVLPGLEEVFADLPRRVEPGDTVLFSPACASFDRYRDYAQRGRHFQEMVEAYRRGRESDG